MSRSVTVRAPAKVNLSLRVLGRRPDGFHEVRTTLQAVDLCDRLSVTMGDPGGVTLEVSGADVGPAEDNLALRAAAAYRDAWGSGQAVHVALTKVIPAGAGLGGGSSDAAGVLGALQRLTAGAVPRGELLGIAARLGSDVPFFLGASALATARGRGELLEPLEPLPQAGLVVVFPPVHVSTAQAYAGLARPPLPPTSESGVPGDRGPGSWSEAFAAAANDFEESVCAAHPEVGRSLDALRRRDYPLALLSGSGGACFAVMDDARDAAREARSLEDELGWACAATRTLSAFPDVEGGGDDS